MIRTLRAAAAVAALLCLSSRAHAGPLTWGYRATAPDGTVLREKHGLTDLVWSDFFLPDPKLYGTPVADPNPSDHFHSDHWRSDSRVTIFDERTGQRGSFRLYADFVQEYALGSEGARELIYEGVVSNVWPEPTVFTLGGSTYEVRAPGGEFLVRVTPAAGGDGGGPVAATPEPGSLALAGFGLVAVLTGRLRRRRAAVAALACGALVGLGGTASAGPIPEPIQWSMRSDPDYSRFGNEFYFGASERPRAEPGGGYELVHLYGAMPEGLLPVGAGSQDNILLAAHSKNAYRYDSAPPSNPAATNTVPYTVWVTDAASGETGFLQFDLTAFYLTGLPTTDYGEVVFGGSGGGTLVLGGNRYTLDVNTGDGDEGTYITANLSVAPAAATPEPGTLALAALGLGAVFARRLRRAG